MTSGNSEPQIRLVLASHFSQEMIADENRKALFIEMLRKLLGFGVLPAFEVKVGESSLGELLEKSELEFCCDESGRFWVVGEILAGMTEDDEVNLEGDVSLLTILQDLERDGDILIVNSFLFQEDSGLLSRSDVVAAPAGIIENGDHWENASFITASDPLEGWLDWAGQMLKGIDHQASYLRWNKSRIAEDV